MASWFSHKDCGGEILIDCSKAVSLLATFGISDDGLRVGLGSLQTKKQSVFEPEFICKNCGRVLTLENIEIVCMHCGNIFPITEIFKPQGVGGAYCRPCIDTHFKSFNKIPMVEIIKRARA